jgi:hypothetical protein
MTSRLTRVLMLSMVLTAGATARAALEDSSYTVPLSDEAVGYNVGAANDPVAQLQKLINEGKVKLEWDEKLGYLPAVLKHLHAMPSSQTLVFSKTSFQLKKINPQRPRAVYFSDDSYIGYCQGGDVLELASVDPKLGTMFYALDQDRVRKPQFKRMDECLQCHQSPKTVGVPGLTVRSVHVEPDGQPILSADHFTTDHRSPVEQRWGGWYVSGTSGNTPHMGNVVTRKSEPEGTKAGVNVTDLSKLVDVDPYLSPHSDIVALMVLEHQGQMHNLLTRAAYESRMALRDQAALDKALSRSGQLSDSTKSRLKYVSEAVVRHMLFADEVVLEDPIKGTSTFAADFQKLGPVDSKGRSLRQLNLHRTLMEYPCSYLIYSEQFDALPRELKDVIYRRIYDVLTGADHSIKISQTKRDAIREILRETKKGLPEYWK